MPKPAILIIAALSLAALATPEAQVRTSDLQIQLGGIDLVLGMAQDDALRKLSAVYNVNFDNGKWNVTKKGSSYRPLGSMSP
jgi:hypothetical protein